MKRRIIVYTITIFAIALCTLGLIKIAIGRVIQEEKEYHNIPSVSPSSSASVQSNPINDTADNTQKVSQAEELYQKGFQAFLQRKYDDAANLFQQSLDIKPDYYKSLNGLGITLCFKGDYKKGLVLIDRAIAAKPDYVYAYFNKGLAYELMKEFETSIEWYDKAIALNPLDSQNVWSYYGKACIYSEMNNLGKSVENLKKAVEMDPSVKESARDEKDFDNVKNSTEFKKLVE